MKVLGIIPARVGSKGILKKNIKLLNGKPLIYYTIKAALNSCLDKVIVSTDSNEIADISISYGCQVIIRPSELSDDKSPMLPVLIHAIKEVNSQFDAIMTLQPTSPLRKERHINESISLFKLDKNADSLVSVVEVPHTMNPYSIMKEENGYLINYLEQKDLILRRQEKPVFFARNGAAIYITRIDNLNKYIFGGKIIPYKMSKLESIDIDDMEDWELCEKLMK